MGIDAIFFLIPGIFFIIFSIFVYNHYRLHPEKERSIISILFPLITGIIFSISAITGYIGLIILFLFISTITSYIYSKYTLNKHPEMKKNREKYMEIYKKRPIYKFLRIASYITLTCAIFLGVFVLIIVLFNITF